MSFVPKMAPDVPVGRGTSPPPAVAAMSHVQGTKVGTVPIRFVEWNHSSDLTGTYPLCHLRVSSIYTSEGKAPPLE
jgi:hypothetical protein